MLNYTRIANMVGKIFRYPKAIEIFEAIARQSINNSLLKYSVKGILLNAGICQLCKGDVVAITNALERYQVRFIKILSKIKIYEFSVLYRTHQSEFAYYSFYRNLTLPFLALENTNC